MAVTETIGKISVNMRLNNGVKQDGTQLTVTDKLPDLNVNTYDNEKAMAVVDKISPCLEKDIYDVQKVTVATLTNED